MEKQGNTQFGRIAAGAGSRGRHGRATVRAQGQRAMGTRSCRPHEQKQANCSAPTPSSFRSPIPRAPCRFIDAKQPQIVSRHSAGYAVSARRTIMDRNHFYEIVPLTMVAPGGVTGQYHPRGINGDNARPTTSRPKLSIDLNREDSRTARTRNICYGI